MTSGKESRFPARGGRSTDDGPSTPELYGCTRTPERGRQVDASMIVAFAEIRRIETEHPWLKAARSRVADPAIWDASRGESVAQTAARYGVYFSPGDNERIAGGCSAITGCSSTRTVSADVCVPNLQGVYPDGAADAVFADAAGGSGHGAGGGPCVRRVAVFLHVAAGAADPGRADGGDLVGSASTN